MSCQASVPPVMWSRKAGKVGKPIIFNIGLLCSKTFDDSIFEELFETKYGLATRDIIKMNIKGVFQIWMRNGDYHEINLKECHAWTRDGCNHCPDFAAEHADISTGGIGKDNDWTLTIVRTELGEAVIKAMLDDAHIHARPPGRQRPGRHRADAQARGQVTRAVAAVGRRAGAHRPAREEEEEVAPAPAPSGGRGQPGGQPGARVLSRPAGRS